MNIDPVFFFFFLSLVFFFAIRSRVGSWVSFDNFFLMRFCVCLWTKLREDLDFVALGTLCEV